MELGKISSKERVTIALGESRKLKHTETSIRSIVLTRELVETLTMIITSV